MVCVYVSRLFGLGIHVTETQLEEINKMKRKSKKYLSTNSAMNVNGNTQKQCFTSTHLLMKYFDFGIHKEGYWTHDHMALQNEDVYDILSCLYPQYDLAILSDQSSGHEKRREDALHAPSMSVNWGGQQCAMHKTVIRDIGPYEATLKVGQVQHMVVRSTDKGLFYEDHQSTKRHPKETGKSLTIQKSKEQLPCELKHKKNFSISRFMTTKQVVEIENSKGLSTYHKVKEMTKGWQGSPKGILQVLWE